MKVLFNVKKEVKNCFIINSKTEKEAKKIYQSICDNTDIIERLLDDEVSDDIVIKSTYNVIPKEVNDNNRIVEAKVDNEVK